MQRKKNKNKNKKKRGIYKYTCDQYICPARHAFSLRYFWLVGKSNAATTHAPAPTLSCSTPHEKTIWRRTFLFHNARNAVRRLPPQFDDWRAVLHLERQAQQQQSSSSTAPANNKKHAVRRLLKVSFQYNSVLWPQQPNGLVLSFSIRGPADYYNCIENM
jgi:hypothetical protein